MSKVTFTKLGLKKKDEVKEIVWGENEIEVKQYLPIEEKIEFVQSVLNNSSDDNNFANLMKINIYYAIELITRYTNITFTDKQKEDLPKLYDLFVESGLYSQICEAIPQEESMTMADYVHSTIDEYYKQQNSAWGLMEKVSTDYSGLDFDAKEIRDKLQSGDLGFLKEVMEKMG